MANYQQHISFSVIVGISSGIFGYFALQQPPAVCLLAMLLAAVGGFIPDLDSDHSIPARETFAFLAAIAPILLLWRLGERQLPLEWLTVLIAALYLTIRFGVSRVFRRLTVHRGMWHSIPAVVILGELVFLTYSQLRPGARLFVALSAMAGMFSHLLLDEIYAVDFMGLRLKRNQFSGSAISLYSASATATAFTYLLLVGLAFLIYRELS